MALKDVEVDASDLLAAAGIGLTLGEDLFCGPLPDREGRCVSVREMQGDRSDCLGRTSTVASELQVIVQSRRDRYAEGRALAASVWEACWLPEMPGYIEVRPRGGAPFYLGPTEEGRHTWTFTVWMRWHYEALPIP